MVHLFRRPTLPLLLILVIHLGLLVPTVTRQGISWDEQTDLDITRAYLNPGGWLRGSPLDLSQTRLPHASVALIYTLTGTSDLITARLVSVLVGLLTLVGVYVYCRPRFGMAVALLAAGLLATSPFYLSFARVAFTETDIYLACILIYLLIALDHFRLQPNLGLAAGVGLLLGLALSAKFTTLSIIPAVVYAVFQGKRGNISPDLSHVNRYQVGGVVAAVCTLVIAGLAVANTLLSGTGAYHYRLPAFLLLLLGWLLGLAWLARHRDQTSSPILLSVLIVSLAFLTFFLTPPDHLTNPAILNSLLDRFQNEVRYNLVFMIEAAGLHVFSTLFKSSPLIGLWLLLSWLLILPQWRRPELRAPILVSWLYFGGLLLLPLAQTFYVIPILPILTIFAAERFFYFAAHWRWPVYSLGIAAAIFLVADLVTCYPDYNLNGYQWLGARQLLGRPSIGYRSVVQTPSDGVEQVIYWLNGHAAPGDQVTSYLLEEHIVNATAPEPQYQIINGFSNPGPPTTQYVVTEINTAIPQSWWRQNTSSLRIENPWNSWLNNHYTKAFSIQRAFGIEMAAVWKKKQ